jgi:hypothetical protein
MLYSPKIIISKICHFGENEFKGAILCGARDQHVSWNDDLQKRVLFPGARNPFLQIIVLEIRQSSGVIEIKER